MKTTQIPFSPEINPGDTVAVGDIHGCLDLLDKFLDHVKGSNANVILLGDLIDRGPDDLGVLERVKQLLDDPQDWGLASFAVLLGNHEKLFINAMEGSLPEGILWVKNGGDTYKAFEMEKHLPWIKKLPIYKVVGDTLFVHGGVFPGESPEKSIAEGKEESLIWMRDPFLAEGPQLEKWTTSIKRVVHGHTPYFDERMGQVNVSESGDRVGIDTAAVYCGILTMYNSTRNTLWRFFNDL
jgi:serine/threonine protein phosphatase 1